MSPVVLFFIVGLFVTIPLIRTISPSSKYTQGLVPECVDSICALVKKNSPTTNTKRGNCVLFFMPNANIPTHRAVVIVENGLAWTDSAPPK